MSESNPIVERNPKHTRILSREIYGTIIQPRFDEILAIGFGNFLPKLCSSIYSENTARKNHVSNKRHEHLFHCHVWRNTLNMNRYPDLKAICDTERFLAHSLPLITTTESKPTQHSFSI